MYLHQKGCPTPSNTNTPTGQAPVFTIPTGGFQFRILSDTTINLSQYVSDPQNDGWDLVSGSLSVDNGTVSYNNSTKELTYSAPTNTSLTSDVIRFTLSDTNGNTQSYNVNISLTTSPTNSDPDYGVEYTKFIYDGVSYVSAYGIGLGNATSDIKEVDSEKDEETILNRVRWAVSVLVNKERKLRIVQKSGKRIKVALKK